MTRNRLLWGLVSLFVLSTIAIWVGTTTYSQKNPSNEQDNRIIEDLGKYAIADYNAPEPQDDKERENRKQKNKRYDNQGWVFINPHPDDGMVGLFDEIPPPPLIPVAKSDLVIVGEVVNANAHMSNDKRSIYTEFQVRVEQVLKSDSKSTDHREIVNADRAGGYVRYPHGQKVLYRNSTKDLPVLGNRYILFLARDEKSPNYEILTGYELKGDSVVPLDKGRLFDEYHGVGEIDFIKEIRNHQPSTQKNNR